MSEFNVEALLCMSKHRHVQLLRHRQDLSGLHALSLQYSGTIIRSARVLKLVSDDRETIAALSKLYKYEFNIDKSMTPAYIEDLSDDIQFLQYQRSTRLGSFTATNLACVNKRLAEQLRGAMGIEQELRWIYNMNMHPDMLREFAEALEVVTWIINHISRIRAPHQTDWLKVLRDFSSSDLQSLASELYEFADAMEEEFYKMPSDPIAFIPYTVEEIEAFWGCAHCDPGISQHRVA